MSEKDYPVYDTVEKGVAENMTRIEVLEQFKENVLDFMKISVDQDKRFIKIVDIIEKKDLVEKVEQLEQNSFSKKEFENFRTKIGKIFSKLFKRYFKLNNNALINTRLTKERIEKESKEFFRIIDENKKLSDKIEVLEQQLKPLTNLENLDEKTLLKLFHGRLNLFRYISNVYDKRTETLERKLSIIQRTLILFSEFCVSKFFKMNAMNSEEYKTRITYLNTIKDKLGDIQEPKKEIVLATCKICNKPTGYYICTDCNLRNMIKAQKDIREEITEKLGAFRRAINDILDLFADIKGKELITLESIHHELKGVDNEFYNYIKKLEETSRCHSQKYHL